MAKVRKANRPQGSRPVARPAPVRKSATRRAAVVAEPSDRVIELLRMAMLAAICAAIWCTIYDRWSPEHWSVPIEYGINPAMADVKGVFSGIRAAEDGHFFPGAFHFEPRLNAPYQANWNDYPFTEDFLIWAPGILARAIGLFPAANFLLLFVQVLAVLAFYYAARRLKCGWKWSAAGALLFGLAPYAFAHSLHHVDIACYWHIPLGIMVCFWIAGGLRFRTRDYWLAIAVAVIFGFQNIYYTNIFIQSVGVSLIIRWLRTGARDWRVCLPALSIAAAAIATVFLLVLRVPLYAMLHGHNAAAVVRNYAQMEYYGLKLVDCFMPFPTHKVPALAAIGKAFYSMTALPAEEPPACYFGIVGIAAFLWLAVVTVRNAILRGRERIPFEAVLTLWIFFYATVGGINAMMGVFGFQMFRSTTRYCIVILCLAFLFAARRLTLISRRWPSPWPTLAPIAFAIIGLWEFLPPAAGEDITFTKTVVDSDRTFAQTMEAVLPKGGMVFQLPVMDFPESPIPNLSGYDHFRPYFYTHDLRFSFGSDKGRAQEAWQRVIVGLTPADQISALERYGFCAIYVNRLGYYPDKGEGLLAKYKAAGRTQIIESPLRDVYCVVLHPSPNPVLPPPGPLFALGWYAEEDNPNGIERERLASGPTATLVLTNPDDTPVDKYANFILAGAGQGTVTIQGAGAFQSWTLDPRHPTPVNDLHFTLSPGENQIVFTTTIPPAREQMGPVTFDVVNFILTGSTMP